ncbi:MAG TPA: LUD domain-containing protein, partial [Rhizomicrobium sp.]
PQMSARENILAAIRARRLAATPMPAPYRPAPQPGDAIAFFTERALAAHAEVRVIASIRNAPEAIAAALRERNLAARIHLPPGSALNAMAWNGMTVEQTAPGPDDTAIALAPFGISETGTLVYASGTATPASWHFRAGFEIAILRADAITPHLEDVIAQIKSSGLLPHTVNLVTGPSRTGDIEQTLELGAHGPKNLAILIVRD